MTLYYVNIVGDVMVPNSYKCLFKNYKNYPDQFRMDDIAIGTPIGYPEDRIVSDFVTIFAFSGKNVDKIKFPLHLTPGSNPGLPMFNSSGVVKNEVAFLPRFENRGCGPPGRMARRHPTGKKF